MMGKAKVWFVPLQRLAALIGSPRYGAVKPGLTTTWRARRVGAELLPLCAVPDIFGLAQTNSSAARDEHPSAKPSLDHDSERKFIEIRAARSLAMIQRKNVFDRNRALSHRD